MLNSIKFSKNQLEMCFCSVRICCFIKRRVSFTTDRV